MPCEAVNCGATLLFMGTMSRVCGGGHGSVPEVLFNMSWVLILIILRDCKLIKLSDPE